MKKKPVDYDKIVNSQLFRWWLIKKNAGIIPLIFVLGATLTSSVSIGLYFLATKTCVRFDRTKPFYPYEYVKGDECRRFWVSPFFRPAIKPIPEVEQLRKEIGYRRYPMKGDH